MISSYDKRKKRMTDLLVKDHLSNSKKLQSKKRKSIDKDTMDYDLIRKRINKLIEIEIKQIEQAKELSSELREKIDENQKTPETGAAKQNNRMKDNKILIFFKTIPPACDCF